MPTYLTKGFQQNAFQANAFQGYVEIILSSNLFFRARKQIGKQLICRHYPETGRQDVYDYVLPQDKKTEKQQANRMKFKAAMTAWAALSEEARQPYEDLARKRALYGKNIYVSRFMKDEL